MNVTTLPENGSIISATEADKLTLLIFNCILCGISLYILIALCFYQYTMIYWKVASDNRHYKIARTLQIILITGMCFALVHNVCEIIAQFATNSSCALGILWLLTYSCGILTAYVFLWQRQYWLYHGRLGVGHLVNRKVKTISWLALAFLVFSAIMIFLAGSRMLTFSSCGDGALHSSKLKLYEAILAITLLILTIVGQTLLLVLFIIPLHNQIPVRVSSSRVENIEQNEPTNNSLCGTQSAQTPASQKTTSIKETSATIVSLTKRCIALASLSMLTDIVAATMTIWTGGNYGKLMYDVNILTNMLCCLGSFRNLSDMIYPWKRTKKAYKDKRAREITMHVRETSGSKVV